MGTVVEIKVVWDDPDKADEAIYAAFSRMRDIEDQMSAKKTESWLHRINKGAVEKPLKIPDDLIYVLGLCQDYSYITDGGFDISIGAISQLWDFDKQTERIPTEEEINNALKFIDFRKIHLDKGEGTIKLDISGMTLDLGAAAKGYAVDEAVKRLKEMGIRSGLVNAGGDLKGFGRKPDGKLWYIGIQDPHNSQKIIGSLYLDNEAVVTSGDYERYIVYEGTKYHHILDPKTGWPARDCKSVSIACKRAVEADILSTGIFVIGPDRGMGLIESLPGIEGMIIDNGGNIHISSGWREVLMLEKRSG